MVLLRKRWAMMASALLLAACGPGGEGDGGKTVGSDWVELSFAPRSAGAKADASEPREALGSIEGAGCALRYDYSDGEDSMRTGSYVERYREVDWDDGLVQGHGPSMIPWIIERQTVGASGVQERVYQFSTVIDLGIWGVVASCHEEVIRPGSTFHTWEPVTAHQGGDNCGMAGCPQGMYLQAVHRTYDLEKVTCDEALRSMSGFFFNEQPVEELDGQQLRELFVTQFSGKQSAEERLYYDRESSQLIGRSLWLADSESGPAVTGYLGPQSVELEIEGLETPATGRRLVRFFDADPMEAEQLLAQIQESCTIGAPCEVMTDAVPAGDIEAIYSSDGALLSAFDPLSGGREATATGTTMDGLRWVSFENPFHGELDPVKLRYQVYKDRAQIAEVGLDEAGDIRHIKRQSFFEPSACLAKNFCLEHSLTLSEIPAAAITPASPLPQALSESALDDWAARAAMEAGQTLEERYLPDGQLKSRDLPNDTVVLEDSSSDCDAMTHGLNGEKAWCAASYGLCEPVNFQRPDPLAPRPQRPSVIISEFGFGP